jgi:hypothetical protein
LLNLPESVNQYDWAAARKDNANIIIHTPDQANFAATMDDALWMVRKIAKLSRADFAEIVANSYYPEGVAKVLVEKMISRRNSLVSTFGTKEAQLEINPKVSDPPTVVDGKVIQQKTWPGYASNFSIGDEQSPLKGIQYYVLSEVQANAMEALMDKINLELPQLNEADAHDGCRPGRQFGRMGWAPGSGERSDFSRRGAGSVPRNEQSRSARGYFRIHDPSGSFDRY